MEYLWAKYEGSHFLLSLGHEKKALLRPISILPVLSKVSEKLVAQQIVDYIELNQSLKQTISGFSKGHSTTTVLLRIRDDIIRAMKKGKFTLMVLADYSKAFDTVSYSVIIQKMLTWVSQALFVLDDKLPLRSPSVRAN